MYKHYITLDVKGSVIKGFSSEFEQPAFDDICINENGGRQFELMGEINPNIFNHKGQPLYTYKDNIVLALTDAEREALYPVIVEPSMSLSTRLDLVEAMLNDMLGI